ncbi:MAG TPA: bifunctional phosphopantothenoylcysteine decarboxylase/phosphopantothenate--cysteine ligase CoaBC, partial [Bacillota bacterium]|nr:bifunctional phosphopantothenoylcysteine decarboxylase/phosphopantothenate--cysteine ligase CoaBC [Bacillota bacterium]
TANFIGKAANGIADDMLTTTIMALGCPVVVAPAMNDAMWANDAVQANVLKLKGLGYVFAGPVTGRLACGTEGLGRMAEPDAIFDVVMHSYLAIGRSSLKGVKLLVSAGPTVEPIDPVRYIANRSSGKMGYALASAAAARGAEVTLVSGPTALPDPLNVEVKRVDTAEQMLKALEGGFEGCDAFVATAAVADYRAKEYSDRKIKKEKAGMKELELVENPDILAKLSSMKGGRLMVGFAAETEDAIESAMGKYSRKGLDMIVVNEVNERNQPFGAEDNIVSIITGKGEVESLPRMSKSELSHMILDRISELMA